MDVGVKAFSYEDGALRILDQSRLPLDKIWLNLKTTEDVAEAIVSLRVRGAPAIGVAGAYGLALSVSVPSPLAEARERLEAASRLLVAARPTAVNLSWALSRVLGDEAVLKAGSQARLFEAVLEAARRLEDEDRHLGERIGEEGARLLKGSPSILTHCNTGALATAGPGTALSVITHLWEDGDGPEIYVSETRPLLQGARLTTFELQEAGIPATLLVDSARAWLMRKKGVGAVVVGADRIARNGDTANKIGTYELALAARAHSVPFYVAAPSSSFDGALASGEGIPIEERPADEVRDLFGHPVAPRGFTVWNPAFDVTPGELVSGFITEFGTFRPTFPEKLFQREEVRHDKI